MKILLLEDDVILQDIIEEYLLETGYEVESFFDGEKALDAIGSKIMICCCWMSMFPISMVLRSSPIYGI